MSLLAIRAANHSVVVDVGRRFAATLSMPSSLLKDRGGSPAAGRLTGREIGACRRERRLPS
jgi:hypothetical protein